MSRIPDIDRQPGLVAIDTVVHCGNSAKGQYAFTLTATDVFTGWTVNQAIKTVVRRSAFNYRYHTVTELGLLNELWPPVNLRKNLFLPTKKVTGYHLSRKRKSVRNYVDPRTPAQRIENTGVMLEPQRHHLGELYASQDLADLMIRINEIQRRLIRLAAAKTYSQAPHAA